MGHFPYLTFTRLLRDGSPDGLGRFATSLASTIAAWHGVDDTAVRFRPSDPLKSWCSPVSEGAPKGDVRSVVCDLATGDVSVKWRLLLQHVGVPGIWGSLFADRPGEELDETIDLRDYGDHLIKGGVADTARNIDAPQEVRGFASGILLETRLEALAGKLPSFISADDIEPYATLIRAVEEALCGGTQPPEILSGVEGHRDMERFLERCDAAILERLGAKEFARILAPLGLTVSQWLKAS